MTDAEMSAWCRAEAANWTSAASHYADDSGMRRVQEERATVLRQIANRLDSAWQIRSTDGAASRRRFQVTIRLRDRFQPEWCSVIAPDPKGACEIVQRAYHDRAKDVVSIEARPLESDDIVCAPPNDAAPSPHSDGLIVQEPLSSGTPYDATTAENWHRRVFEDRCAHAPQHPIEEG